MYISCQNIDLQIREISLNGHSLAIHAENCRCHRASRANRYQWLVSGPLTSLQDCQAFQCQSVGRPESSISGSISAEKPLSKQSTSARNSKLANLIPHLVLIRRPGFALNVAIGSPLNFVGRNPCQLGIGQLSRVSTFLNRLQDCRWIDKTPMDFFDACRIRHTKALLTAH